LFELWTIRIRGGSARVIREIAFCPVTVGFCLCASDGSSIH